MIDIHPLLENELPLLERLPFARPETHRRRFERQVHGHLVFQVAWKGELPVGQALLQWEGIDHAADEPRPRPYPEISSLFVAPDYRLQGIARKLIQVAESTAYREGYRNVGLCVAVDNAPARRLYERLGYQDPGWEAYTARGVYVDRSGGRQSWEETRIYLTKSMDQPAYSAT